VFGNTREKFQNSPKERLVGGTGPQRAGGGSHPGSKPYMKLEKRTAPIKPKTTRGLAFDEPMDIAGAPITKRAKKSDTPKRRKNPQGDDVAVVRAYNEKKGRGPQHWIGRQYAKAAKPTATPNPKSKASGISAKARVVGISRPAANDVGGRPVVGTKGTETLWTNPKSGWGTHWDSKIRIGAGTGTRNSAAMKVAKGVTSGFGGVSGNKYESKQPKSRTYGHAGGPKNTKFYMKGAQPGKTGQPEFYDTNGKNVVGKRLQKDITSAFVPSIGVKQGRKRDLQSPAKNIYPPYGKK